MQLTCWDWSGQLAIYGQSGELAIYGQSVCVLGVKCSVCLDDETVLEVYVFVGLD